MWLFDVPYFLNILILLRKGRLKLIQKVSAEYVWASEVHTTEYNTIQYCYLYSAFPGYPAQSAVLLTYQLIIVTSLEHPYKNIFCAKS
jgi:hypothetical protein